MRLSRACIARESMPKPDCTATYCVPPTLKVDAGAIIPELVGNSHNTWPVVALNALKLVGEDELKPLVVANGKIETRCEFCGKGYEVSAIQFSELFQQLVYFLDGSSASFRNPLSA